jgi:hypothetical protein
MEEQGLLTEGEGLVRLISKYTGLYWEVNCTDQSPCLLRDQLVNLCFVYFFSRVARQYC